MKTGKYRVSMEIEVTDEDQTEDRLLYLLQVCTDQGAGYSFRRTSRLKLEAV